MLVLPEKRFREFIIAFKVWAATNPCFTLSTRIVERGGRTDSQIMSSSSTPMTETRDAKDIAKLPAMLP